MKKSKQFKRQTIIILFFVFVPVLLIASFNFFVDPLQIYRQQNFVEPRFWKNQRYQNAGKIKKYLGSSGYNSVLIGSSVVDNFKPSDISNILGWGKLLSLTVDGSTIATQSFMLKQSLLTGNVNNVLWGLQPFIVVRSGFDYRYEIPTYLYTNTIFDDGPYLLNLDTSRKSIQYLQYNLPEKFWGNNIDSLNYWMTLGRAKIYATYCKSEPLQKMQDMVRLVPQININQTLKEKEFPFAKKYVVDIVTSYPKVNFLLFFPPESMFLLKARGEYLAKMIGVQRYLVKELSQLNNVSIYGFEDLQFNSNMANYRDGQHYHAGVNLLMLEIIRSKKGELNAVNIDSYLSRLLKKINSYKFICDPNSAIPMYSKAEQKVWCSEIKNQFGSIPPTCTKFLTINQ